MYLKKAFVEPPSIVPNLIPLSSSVSALVNGKMSTLDDGTMSMRMVMYKMMVSRPLASHDMMNICDDQLLLVFSVSNIGTIDELKKRMRPARTKIMSPHMI